MLRSLAPGLIAIALAASVLLISDLARSSRTSTSAARVYRVAMLQMASQPIIEDGAAGVVSALEEAGYVQGANLKLERLNAEGDMATARAMADKVTNGYDLVVTLTTPCLQAMARSNQQGKVPHVFGMVSDPTISGVGIGRNPGDHPKHMVGIGSLPPADESIVLARQFLPGLKRIGVVWNPAEVNSEIATKAARTACKRLKIELLEANSGSTAEVGEAAASLVARGIDALWVGGDVTVLGAIDVVIKAARQARIPVFTCIPGNAPKGTLFDLGANYYEVGRKTGKLAARVLGGEPIASLPWESTLPPKLFLNLTALKDLKDPWKFTSEILEKADAMIDDKGLHEKNPVQRLPPASKQALSKVWRVRLVSYINSLDTEDAEHGVREGLKSAGVLEGRDFEWKSLNAQGDMSALNGLVDAALNDRADLIVTVSTQSLQTALKRAKTTPIVFTMVANPFAAGVARSDADHLPNLTGAYGANDIDGMLPLLKQVVPGVKKIGALYSPAEVNSVYNYELLVKAAKRENLELVAAGISTPSEASDATQSLCGQRIDALCLPNSNLAGSCFPTIAQAARRGKVPLFGFLGAGAKQGAVLVLARDYFDMGRDAGLLAARVMRGESPAKVPLHPTTTNRLLINLDAAKECGLTIPEEIRQKASK